MKYILCALLASTAFSAAIAAENPPLTPSDVFALEEASDPQISPDGTQVVYVRSGSDVMKDGSSSQLWLVGVDGSGAKPLTRPGEAVGSPRWSPDGKRLVYSAMRDDGPRIVIRWMTDGSEADILPPGPAEKLSWSPDGSQIAFLTFVPEAPRQIGTAPTPPPGAKWKPAPMVIDRSLYRADGIGYLPSGRQQIFVAPANGGAVRRVTHDKHDYGAPPISGPIFDWTPDGKSLVVEILNKTEDEVLHGKFFDSGLYSIQIADGATTKIVDEAGPEGSPSVSPDGEWIAYTGYREAVQFHGQAKLSVINRKTGEQRVLSSMLDRDVEAPRWSPDGKGIYAFYADGGVTRLGLFNLKGGRRDVAEGLGMAFTAYSAAPSYSLARDGSFVLQLNTLETSGNIGVGAPGRPLRTITTHNQPLLAQRTLGRVEPIRYNSSVDNLPIEGWIVYPPGFDPASKYPMILEIHGGPNASYGARFDIEKQILAGAGYVVFYANPRGSTAYGDRFANLVTDRFPGDEYFDLISGVDAVIARGFIDPKQLYVAGGSGGGTLTAQMIERTDRFRAAAVLYPVIDFQSQALTSDILPLVFNGFFHGTPWSQPEVYARQSLLRDIDKIKTPTLVMAGEADYRTPISESEQFYSALRYFGVESVFIRFPLENHGLRMFPSHFAAKMSSIIGWFKEHQ